MDKVIYVFCNVIDVVSVYENLTCLISTQLNKYSPVKLCKTTFTVLCALGNHMTPCIVTLALFHTLRTSCVPVS